MSGRKPQSKRRSFARQRKRPEGAPAHDKSARSPATRVGQDWELLDEQSLLEMRHMVRAISRELDKLQVILRAMEVLESKQAIRSWFNGVVPALGARPIDLCRTAQGRQAVLRELGRIEHGVHS